MKYSLPELPYKYDSLAPYIDEMTMRIHHTKHHQAYINNLNTVLEKYPRIADKKLEDLMMNLDSQPFDQKDKTVFRNNAGGHLNHSFFLTIMAPEKEIDRKLLEKIKKEFGSEDEFKKQFTASAMGRFGSGWAWLVETPDNKLQVYSTPNQDSPILKGDTPIIGIDVWEHAYYLKYQNKRLEYIENWFNVLKLI